MVLQGLAFCCETFEKKYFGLTLSQAIPFYRVGVVRPPKPKPLQYALLDFGTERSSLVQLRLQLIDAAQQRTQFGHTRLVVAKTPDDASLFYRTKAAASPLSGSTCYNGARESQCSGLTEKGQLSSCRLV